MYGVRCAKNNVEILLTTKYFEIMKNLIKSLRNALYILLTVVFAVCILTPFVYWTMNPELTQMQVFIKCWWVMLIGIAAAIFGAIPILNNR